MWFLHNTCSDFLIDRQMYTAILLTIHSFEFYLLVGYRVIPCWKCGCGQHQWWPPCCEGSPFGCVVKLDFLLLVILHDVESEQASPFVKCTCICTSEQYSRSWHWIACLAYVPPNNIYVLVGCNQLRVNAELLKYLCLMNYLWWLHAV